MPVAKLSGMLLRPEAGTIISIFYYFDLFICIFQLQSGQLRSTLLVSVHPDKLWVYLFHYHTGHRQCFKYQLTRDLVFWLISRVQTDFSAGIVIIAACLCRWPFFQLHFLHLQFLLVQILCKDMFFNVLLGNVVCGCVCAVYQTHICNSGLTAAFSVLYFPWGLSLKMWNDHFCTDRSFTTPSRLTLYAFMAFNFCLQREIPFPMRKTLMCNSYPYDPCLRHHVF